MKPRKNHPWRYDVRGVLRFAPLDGRETPVRILSASEIRELGYTLTIPLAEIAEARRMCQRTHPDKGGDPRQFQLWKQRLDRLRRRR
jgi:hypothetical protein